MNTFKSMTGYGRASVQKKGVQLVAEVLSVNRKHLDINIILPRHFARFDPSIRKMIAANVLRGHLTIRVSASFERESPLLIHPNLALIRQLHRGWQDVAQAIGASPHEISLTLLKDEPDLFVYEEDPGMMDLLEKQLLEAVNLALQPFLAMREIEGQVIQKEIAERLQFLSHQMDQIAIRSSNASDKFREKLFQKIQEVLPNLATADERLLKEIALYAEKIDTAEEIARFKSHLAQFERLLSSGQEAAGKTAEFLLQELVRETNTLGSKTSEYEVSKMIVEIKSELERIREQIQNVE